MTSTSDPFSTSADQRLANTFQREWGRLLSLLVARTRRLDLAEDALAEAFARAGERWSRTGVPDNPTAWLYTTATRHVIGQVRAEAIVGRKAPLLAVGASWVRPTLDDPDTLGDERLAMILLTCHPAVHPEARAPLALRLVVGTSTEEIARLHLVSTATMAARITRAKKKIVAAGIPLSSPVDDELRSRLHEVCQTIYLAFTAGYTPGDGQDLLRADLAAEAVELASVTHRLVPDAAEPRALLALLLLQHSRRGARVHDGRLVLLADQDRSLWDHQQIAAGTALLAGLGPVAGNAESFRLQALIAAEHGRAASADETDWVLIADTYQRLEELTGSPVVRLNRAVAVAEVHGPHAGLALLDGIDDAVGTSHRLFAVRAELARRSGDLDLARASYDAAVARCTNDIERAHLADRRNTLGPTA